jgi:hypothetical protein
VLISLSCHSPEQVTPALTTTVSRFACNLVQRCFRL